MPLSPPATIAAQIVSDIEAQTPAAGTPISNEQILAIWTAVVNRIYTDLKTNAMVNPGSFTTDTGSVTGEGGPLV